MFMISSHLSSTLEMLTNQSPQESPIKAYVQLGKLRKEGHKIYPVTQAILDVRYLRGLAWNIS